MEKILNFLKNPFTVGAVAGVALLITFIDSFINSAGSYSELGDVGKIAVVVFMASLAWLVIRNMVIAVIVKIFK